MRSEILLIIIGMGVVTYLPRCLPLFLLSRRPLPPWLIDWLDF
ncbi:MAG: AzlD domain-containing protein, partial [Proteobacteria bacterium]|nr:AzlD domain-containing protein [Pseudomonadota bacterium]